MRTPTLGTIALSTVSLLIAVASACSGRTAGEAGGGGTDGGADSSPLPPDCPATVPAEGTSCSKDQILCEYGSDYDPRCNTQRVCSTGTWASPVGFGGRPTCPSTPPTVGPNPAACAPTRASVPVGAACSGGDSCAYDGSTCFCGRFCPNYPIRQPDCDGGTTVGCCDAKVQWNCFDGPAFCPQPRPRVGSACAKDGESCAVSSPVECGQATIVCKGGVWTLNDFGCPVSTARVKRDVEYVDRTAEERLRSEVLDVRLATYRYTQGDDARHLGFIIEDMPEGSAAVLPSRDRVDLYGYVSMTVAALKAQQREIDALKREVARLEAARAPAKK